MFTSQASLADRLLLRINALEHWLERSRKRYYLLPVRLAGYGLLIGLLMVSNLVAICRWPVALLLEKWRTGESATSPLHLNASGPPIPADADVLQTLIGSGRLVLVDFWAAWCGPCIMMNEPLRRVTHAFGDTCIVAKVDTVKHADVAKAHHVKGLPTLILFDNGEEVERHAGALSYPALNALIKRHAPDQTASAS